MTMKVMMGKDLLDLYLTGRSRRYREVSRNRELMYGFLRAVKLMSDAKDVNELSGVSSLHYEKLKYSLSGYSSVRLSNRYVHRLLFREGPDGLEVCLIEIDDTHYGNK